MNKILGYILLFIGLFCVGFALAQSFQIFMGYVTPPMLFKEISDESQDSTGTSSKLAVEMQLEQQILQQMDRAIPPNAVPQMLNLLSWALFAGIFMFGGTQLTGLGLKIIMHHEEH